MREAVVPAKYRFLAGVDTVRDVSSYQEDLAVDTAVVLECPQRGRIGRASRFLTAQVKIINIDHHRDNQNFGHINWVNPGASSVGEMVYEYFLAIDYAIGPDVAEYLYTAILTDTGRFRFSSTSARTMAIAGELIAAGADPQRICDHAYYSLRPSTMKLIGKVLNTIEFADNGTVCLLTLTKDMLHECGADLSESEGLVDFTLFTEGVQAGVLLKESDAVETKVSLRSRNSVDVATLAAQFGGGGHPNASGCTIPLPLSQAKERLIKLIREARNG